MPKASDASGPLMAFFPDTSLSKNKTRAATAYMIAKPWQELSLA
ncbi:MAG: hypothetical protein SOS50_07025 [Oliverpabstia sp.]|nr:hypothetical protein [Oliverpabstia sp.]